MLELAQRMCVDKVNDEWFANEESVRKAVGLSGFLTSEPSVLPRELTCGICFEDYSIVNMKASTCNHYFCNECWIGYIHAAIDDGPGCLTLRCPHPPCAVAIGDDIVKLLVCKEDCTKYKRYLLRSYVEDNRKIKWCPAPGCEYAVEFIPGSHSYEIFCKCGHNFCWNCLEEAHRPVDCETVKMWILKNFSNLETMTWMLANTKPCPSCKRPIEKNQGCMHMTCSPPCTFSFCWLCLGAWSDHTLGNGGNYVCNKYEKAKREGTLSLFQRDKDDIRREKAKTSYKRSMHYFERWATNESSRAKALSNLQQMQTAQIQGLSEKQQHLLLPLDFMIEAWMQIVACRRILKWTYAYGYYLPENELVRRQLFEDSQGQAEYYLERLHQCAEEDLQALFDDVSPSQSAFDAFGTKLADLTSITNGYFERLVVALEKGLPDVDSSKAAAHVKGT